MTGVSLETETPWHVSGIKLAFEACLVTEWVEFILQTHQGRNHLSCHLTQHHATPVLHGAEILC